MRGDPLGPLHGVPIAVKDLVPTAGIRTTWGSLDFQGPCSGEDAVAVARLKRAGAVIVGKTTTPEFGQQCLTEAPLFGRTRNAWRADRTSGGSSGGSAVAVAAGLVPIAIATDGGGSTRIPAACNGVIGFKQGLGIVPQEYAQDGFGNISYTTPMTRTVRDTALMLDIMAGPDSRDPLTVARDKHDFIAAARPEASLSGLRIGWRPRLGNQAVAREVLAACETALAALADLGADVTEVTTPFENPERVWFVVNGSYRMAQFGHHLEQHRDIMCPTFVRQMDRIASYSAAELYEAIFQRTRLYRQVQSWFADCDIMATPTLARAAVPIDQDFFGPIEIDGCKSRTFVRLGIPIRCPSTSQAIRQSACLLASIGSACRSRSSSLHREAMTASCCVLQLHSSMFVPGRNNGLRRGKASAVDQPCLFSSGVGRSLPIRRMNPGSRLG